MPTPLKFEGDYSHAAMVERAVRNARPRDPGKHARWVAVMDTFAYGSTTSQQICIHFGLDPHEEIEGPRCRACEESAADDEYNNRREADDGHRNALGI